VGYQIGIISLEFIEFSISRNKKSDKKVEKGLKVRITCLLQGFIAREILTKLWLRYNKDVDLEKDRKSLRRQKNIT
jgi:hypothetical protein